MKYVLLTTSQFDRDLKRLSKSPQEVIKAGKALKIMQINPFSEVLRTHQVNIPSLGKVWSSKVTGDLRILWIFDEDQILTIVAIRIQGHDTVYK